MNTAARVARRCVGLMVSALFVCSISMSAAQTTEYQGLGPGYWKNHADEWTGYSFSDDLDKVFCVDAFDHDMTLLEALEAGGGDVYALGRQAVAALLNAADPDINFPLIEAEILLIVQSALLPDGNVEKAKDALEALNDLGDGEEVEEVDEGRGQGYWKNHVEEWVGYVPEDDFDTIFGVDAFDPDRTLLEAIKSGGGDVAALGRKAVAALLNAAHPDVTYPLTELEVIALVQAALAPGGDVEGTKDLLESYNNLGEVDPDKAAKAAYKAERKAVKKAQKAVKKAEKAAAKAAKKAAKEAEKEGGDE